MKKIVEVPKRNYRIECDCGCIFTCEDEDIKKEDIKLLFMKVGEVVTTTCPHCGDEIELDSWNTEIYTEGIREIY